MRKVRNGNDMAKQIASKAWVMIGLITAGMLPLSAYADRTLTEVKVTPLENNRLGIELQLSDAAPEPSVFALESPPRISVDLPNTSISLPNRRIAVSAGAVQTLTAVEAAGRSRVVLSLNELPPYTVRTSGNSVFIELDGAAAVTGVRPASLASARAAPEKAMLSAVDFRRTETGAGRLEVTLSDESASVDVRNEGGKIVASFNNMAVKEELLSRMDVLDFATPVKFVEVSEDGLHAKISITPVSGAQFEQVAYQLGNKFSLELQPLSKQQKEELARAQPEFTGERLNVNFQNIEVRALLQIIADVAGKNLVTSDSVAGAITLRLENVPWDQALDIIMRTKGLSKSENGNVIWIAPTKEVAAQQKQELEANKQADELAPMIGEIIQMNYAKAADIATLLATEDNSFLSERGSVAVDERTNVLIIRDTREKLSEIQRLVQRLDIPVRQVLIESRVVVANDDFSRSIGARFGASFAQASGDNIVAGTGNIIGASGVTTALASGAAGTTAAIPALANRLASSFPASSAGPVVPSYGVSILGSDFLIDLELSALQAEGKGEVVSTPRVITADGKEALIEQGEEIPFTAGGAGAATAQTQFKEAVLALRVTPQITPDDRVIMDLEVSKDSRGAVVPQATGGSAVAIDTSSVLTQVLVNNGETVVLGGIFEQTINESLNKVPLLGDIPFIGYLFRSKTNNNTKRELLIFVTPKILSEGITKN